MTKKHFQAAADIIRFEDDKNKEILIQVFTQFFRGQNPKFDKERFEAACKR